MKKIFAFILFEFACWNLFADGTVSISQGATGGTISIIAATPSSSSGGSSLYGASSTVVVPYGIFGSTAVFTSSMTATGTGNDPAFVANLNGFSFGFPGATALKIVQCVFGTCTDVTGINYTDTTSGILKQGMVMGAGTSNVLFPDSRANGSIIFTSTGEARFGDSTNSKYVGFKAPNTVSSNAMWKLPVADAVGSFQSDGAGNMTISAVSGSTITSLGQFSLGTVFSGNGTTITINSTSTAIVVPYACIVSSWTIVGATGSITIDVGRTSYANFTGTTTSIVGAGTKPVTSINVKGQSVPVGWTSVALAAYDVIQFWVTGVTGVTQASIVLTLTKTGG